MAWALILAITFLVINIALFASTFYQILLLSDLEADYINMYEAASRINGLILPDFILQGVLSVLLLMTGHWFMFLVSVPVTCYHVMLYIKQRHLIDVTEVFRVLGAEKKYRMVKLGLLSVLFLMVIFRPFVISRSPVWRFRYSLIVPGVLEIIYFSFSHLRRLVLSIFESFVDDEDAFHSF